MFTISSATLIRMTAVFCHGILLVSTHCAALTRFNINQSDFGNKVETSSVLCFPEPKQHAADCVFSLFTLQCYLATVKNFLCYTGGQYKTTLGTQATDASSHISICSHWIRHWRYMSCSEWLKSNLIWFMWLVLKRFFPSRLDVRNLASIWTYSSFDLGCNSESSLSSVHNTSSFPNCYVCIAERKSPCDKTLQCQVHIISFRIWLRAAESAQPFTSASWL